MEIHHIELVEDNIDIFGDVMDNKDLLFEWLHANEEFLYRDNL